MNSRVRFKNLLVGLARAEKWNATLILSVLSAYQVLSLASVRDRPVNLVGGRGGGGGGESGRMSSEPLFFAAIIGLQFFLVGMCRTNFFIVIYFRKGRGGVGVKIGSICVSP